MIKAEAFDKAWRLAIKSDFSLFDEIVHPEYESLNQGIKVNKEVSKSVLSGLLGVIILGPYRTIYENNDFVCLHRHTELIGEDVFFLAIQATSYKNNKITTQETVIENLDDDPSEGQDWN